MCASNEVIHNLQVCNSYAQAGVYLMDIEKGGT